MAIQWFPGHMTSARRKAAEALAQNDVVIEVCDARLPEASSNPMIREMRQHRNRPCLKLLNKADLADPNVTRAWLEYYNRQPGVAAHAVSCKNPHETSQITRWCKQLAPHRNDGVKPLRMLIMGIPNVGKSTLMNALLKRRVSAVGDEPAVTKSQLSQDLSPQMSITDTPGLMWPKIAHDSDGFMLAASHAIGRNAVIESEVAAFLADVLLARYPQALRERYGNGIEGRDGVGVVEAIALQRGCRLKGGRDGGELDLEKAAMILLTDYRQCKLGRISLETPATRAAMLNSTIASNAPPAATPHA